MEEEEEEGREGDWLNDVSRTACVHMIFESLGVSIVNLR